MFYFTNQTFHAFSFFLFRNTDGSLSPLIQISWLRRNNNMSSHRWSKILYNSYFATWTIRCQGYAHILWNEDADLDERILPTRHESLSILLHVARKTSHRWRTTPPSYIKWWSCVFRKWIGPLANRWSAMVASTLCSFKILSSFLWKTEGRTIGSRWLGQSSADFARSKAHL